MKSMSKEELITRYNKAKALPTKERIKEFNRLRGAGIRHYGNWKEFRILMGDKKRRKKVGNKQTQLLAAVIHLAHKTGQKVDIGSCINAVRNGYADHIKFKESV